MRNTFTTLSLAALLAFPLCGNAQQLPNNGFEEAWVDCIPWTSKNNSTKQGTQPTGWNISNTIGTGTMGKVTVGSKVEGYNSATAVKVADTKFSFIVTKYIPGYFGLGTSWATSTGTGSNTDGGQFGGLEFTYRPDALGFQYKSAGSLQPTVIAYTWKGTYTQASVPGNIVTSGSPTTVDMVNRDRNILGINTDKGGDVTKTDGAECIAKINTRLEAAAASWTYAELPFEYSSEATPEMINVIFSAGDYFAQPSNADNSLTVDDVKLIYYSRLKDLQVNGTTIDGFASDKYEYAVDAAMPEESAFSFATLGTSGSSKAAVALDTENAKATITVNNVGEDADGQTSHVYTVQFNKESSETPDVPADAMKYTGTLTTYSETLVPEPDVQGNISIYLIPEEDNSITFALYDFTFFGGEFKIGDLILNDVKAEQEGDVVRYTGSNPKFFIEALGTDVALTLDGTVDNNGNAAMKINIVLNDGENDHNIEVTFNGQGPKPSAIEGVDVDNSNAPVEFYNLQGIRVNSSDMAPGIYIRRQGTDVKKVLVK